MSAPTPTVTAFFGIGGGADIFTLNDPVRGLLDNTTYLLGGDSGTDITDLVKVASIERGRSRELDEMNVGVARLTANNHDRTLDPENAAGPYFGLIKPGVHVIIAAEGITQFDGLIDDWNFDYQVSGDSTASFDVADALATLGSAEFDEWTTTAGQLVGARLTDILNRPEVSFPATRSIDTGSSTLQADVVSWGSNVLNYAQLVAKADLGQLFAAKDGTLTFYGRARAITSIGAPVFADDGTGIGYAGIALDYGTELLFNRVSVDAIGFDKQTAVDEASALEFGGGSGRKKYYSLSLSGLPLETEGQALDLAYYLLNLYSQPITRVASITVLLHGIDPADWATVLNLEIGSVIRVLFTPNGVGAQIDKFCMVEGVSEQFDIEFMSVTFHLSNLGEGFGTTPFTLDDATLGLLDGIGRLVF